MAPEPIRGDLRLLVWIIGRVEEGVVLSEAQHTKEALGSCSTWKPWQPGLWLLRLRPLLHVIVILGTRSSGWYQDRPPDSKELTTIEHTFHGVRHRGRNGHIRGGWLRVLFRGSNDFGLHIIFSHDNVIGFISGGGGSRICLNFSGCSRI